MGSGGDATARIAMLLGAGASVDAGLPTSNDFAQKLQQRMAAELPANSLALGALNFVFGAMINHRTERGGDPFEAVNVETMISAIRLLAGRKSHEATPFVERWKPGVSAFVAGSGWVDSSGGERLYNAIERSRRSERVDTYAIADSVREIIDDAATADDGSAVFRDVETELLLRVRRILLAHESVDYLAPLVEVARTQPGGLDVATLNYDLTVERAAAAASVEIDLGEMRRLGVQHAEAPRDGVLRLFKLHGSIDWERLPGDVGARQLHVPTLVRRDDPKADFVPAIVIGDREKLGTDGPTLGLLAAFARALEAAQRLVVVGYSFADAHVNRIVRDWLNDDDDRTITVLDPGFSHHSSGFAGELARALARETDERHAPRLNLVQAGAAAGLTRALHEAPMPEPNPRFGTTAEATGSMVRVELVNRGALLRNVTVDVPLGYRPPSTPTPRSIAPAGTTPTAEYPMAVRVTTMGTGEKVAVTLTFDTDEDARRAQILVSGDGLLGSVREWIDLSASAQ